jgi:hypothetical protein
MKYPNILTIEAVKYAPQRYDGEHWIPARPTGNSSIPNRVKCAWLVFTGKADALLWPKNQ